MCQVIGWGIGSVVLLLSIIAGVGAVISHKVDQERARRWPDPMPGDEVNAINVRRSARQTG